MLRFPELKVQNWQISLTRSAPFSPLLEHFPTSKWGSGGLVGKVWMYTFQSKWNVSIWCPFSPPKMNSPKTASCVSKKGQKVIVCMFFDLLGAQNLMKCLGSGWAGVFHHEKSKNADLLWIRPPHLQGSARRATRWGQKPVFNTKISKLTKSSPNFLNFELGVYHWAPCSFKEASAKIWSGSGLFLCFSALANRPLSTFIFALHTCMWAQ